MISGAIYSTRFCGNGLFAGDNLAQNDIPCQPSLIPTHQGSRLMRAAKVAFSFCLQLVEISGEAENQDIYTVYMRLKIRIYIMYISDIIIKIRIFCLQSKWKLDIK